MTSEFNNSKEIIKTRMLKHALNYWNIKNSDDLDPAVRRLVQELGEIAQRAQPRVDVVEVRGVVPVVLAGRRMDRMQP